VAAEIEGERTVVPSLPVDAREEQQQALGAFIRAQRKLANLSLRQMAEMSQVSNPYLSQVERGLHEPSIRVVQAIAAALGLTPEELLEQAGVFDDVGNHATPSTEAAIRRDPSLSDAQKEALLAVYRSYVEANRPDDRAT
jgi:transcriptional regulator with XRE-family HTH domain